MHRSREQRLEELAAVLALAGSREPKLDEDMRPDVRVQRAIGIEEERAAFRVVGVALQLTAAIEEVPKEPGSGGGHGRLRSKDPANREPSASVRAPRGP